MAIKSNASIEREILRPLWKIHILYHADSNPVVANWLLEELREHGYRVSPGTLYPLLGRMVRLGWLKQADDRRYRLTALGRAVLGEVRARLSELQAEVFRKG